MEEAKIDVNVNGKNDEVKSEKDLFNELRNKINERRESYRRSLYQVKDQIEITKQNLEILEIKKNKLEGAIEASDLSLKDVLPSNKK